MGDRKGPACGAGNPGKGKLKIDRESGTRKPRAGEGRGDNTVLEQLSIPKVRTNREARLLTIHDLVSH